MMNPSDDEPTVTKAKVLKRVACVIFYNPTRTRSFPKGWYVREYHSPVALEKHRKGEKGWDGSYGDTGVFRTEEEARKYAMGELLAR